MDETPAAWLHTITYETGEKSRKLSFSEENAFGVPGLDYSAEFEVVSRPLYLSIPKPSDTPASEE